ncbi:helix-turn-helix domain-containing protein [Bacteroidota bacterium]
MEDRLLKLLDAEHLSSSKFADVIGVQRSSVSHILSGRNKPSFDFLQKTLKAFPALNADWLILGEGNMYEDTVSSMSDGLFNQADHSAEAKQDKMVGIDEAGDKNEQNEALNAANISLQADNNPESRHYDASKFPLAKKRVSRVILFYDDNSFHTYEPDA